MNGIDRWCENVKRVWNERGMLMEQGKMIVHDRSEWIAGVNA